MSFGRRMRIVCCSAPVLLAPFLGGSTERWSQGIVLLLLAVVVAAWPPRSFGFPGFACAALAVICLLAAVSFLPAAWFGLPQWRQQLTGQLGVSLAPALSPQPWVSAGCIVLLLTGMVWICWLASQTWDPGEKRLLADTFVLGAAVLAAVALAAFYCKTPVSFWHSERGFGPFPNRNQSGNFFAISAIPALACAYENFRANKIRALLFVVAEGVLVAALVTSYSRAAVILFFAGASVWIASLALVSRTAKSIAVCASLLIVLAAAFLIFGGETLRRFQGEETVGFGFRWLIYKDVFSLIRSSPWCGIGLGNFEGVFSLFRRESAMPSHILHPESDWLWLWAEMGRMSVVAVVFVAVALFERVLPLHRGTNRRLRLAAAAAALVFAAHGAVDVSGHRLGSALPGLFVLGLALNNPVTACRHRFVPVCFRLAAAVLGTVGALWLAAVWEGWVLPDTTGMEAVKREAQQWIAQKKYFDATVVTTTATARAPLDWELYFLRATAEACDGNWPHAFDDFRRVNALESTSPLVTFEEGRIWLNSRPSLAIPAWSETLRRCPPQEAPQYYARMLDFVGGDSALRGMLHRLAGKSFDLELVYLGGATADEFKDVINGVLHSDPELRSLNDGQKAALFRLWAAKGDAADLMQRFSANAGWQRLAWRQMAGYKAAQGDPQGACETALRFLPPPVLPGISRSDRAGDLRQRLLLHSGDYAAGYALYGALMDEKDEHAAMQVLRGLTARPDCPRYFHFLEARLAFRLRDFAASWSALQKYEPVGN